MSDNSPNSLRPTPKVKSISKKYLILVFGALFIMFIVFYFSMMQSTSQQQQKLEAPTVEITEEEEKVSLLTIEGSGLTIPEEKPPVDANTNENTPSTPTEPIIVIRDKSPTEEQRQIRQYRTEGYLAALSAPLLSKRQTQHSQQASQEVHISGSTQAPASLNSLANQSSYDVSADKDKEAFFSRSQQSDKAWISDDIRTKGQDFEVKTGTVIPAVMVTGINSDLPGNIIAQVSQNVYDTASGMDLLIPQGSKLFGVYDSRVIFGQERVLVAWNRIIFPDGSALTLPAMPGADMSGNAGFHDQVDNHYFRIFGSAILMSLIVGSTSYSVDAMSGDSEDGSSLQSQMTSALAQQLGQTSTSLLEKNLSIKPTLEIRPGYRFNIVLTKDLVFESPYIGWR